MIAVLLVALLSVALLLFRLLSGARSWYRNRHLAAGVPLSKAATTPRRPPLVPGLPLLGNALALGSGGAAYLHQCRKKHGDAFTLRLLGQRMTFVFAPAALQHYFNAPDSQLTFAPAVQQFTHRVFGLPPKHFYHRHLTMLQTLRHQLIPSALPLHTHRLLGLLLAQLRCWPSSGQLDLTQALRGLVFQSSVALLFGPGLLGLAEDGEDLQAQRQQRQQGGWTGRSSREAGARSSGSGGSGHKSRAEQLQQDFFAFEAGFELAASPVPHLLQLRFLICRRRLLAALRSSYAAGHFKGTVAGTLIEACGLPDRYVPNMLLALLWASQANAVPSTFWALGFLLLPENRQHLEAVVQEAERAVAAPSAAASPAGGGDRPLAQQDSYVQGAQEEQPAAAVDTQQRCLLLSEAQQRGLAELSASRRSHAAAAVAEALRLRCFSIDVRIAAADVALPCGVEGPGENSIWVQKGDVVAISPYESHLDPRLYQPHADAYNPARDGMQLGGSTAVHAAVIGVGGVPGLSFGGGKYRCPGRYFAEAELSLITSLLFLLFDWQLLPAGPSACGESASSQKQQSNGYQQQQQQQEKELAPGDPACLLPRPDLSRLVGIKAPAGPCWVQYQRRKLCSA